MSVTFRPARREEAKPLIGIYALSGYGKTWSALLLARGFVGEEGRIGMIETEGGRGEAYVGRAPVGVYDVCPIRGNFSPQAYGAAIAAAEKERYDALIVDSASHEWEGEGGVLAMAAANAAGGKSGVLIWQQPKIDHQRHFMLKLMQTPIPLVIVCMRAKYPMVQRDGVGGNKTWERSDILEPKQSDDILFEMFVHGWIDAAHAFHGTRYTLPELERALVPGQPISVESGARLAAWARERTAAAGGFISSPIKPDEDMKLAAGTSAMVPGEAAEARGMDLIDAARDGAEWKAAGAAIAKMADRLDKQATARLKAHLEKKRAELKRSAP
jgi:hypothetical protein